MFTTLPWINLEILRRIGVVENFWVILESYSNSNSDLQQLGFPPPSLILQSGNDGLIFLLRFLLQSCRSFFSLQFPYKIHLLTPSGLRVIAKLPWVVHWFHELRFFHDIWRSNRWIFVNFISIWSWDPWLQFLCWWLGLILPGLGFMIFLRSDCVGTGFLPLAAARVYAAEATANNPVDCFSAFCTVHPALPCALRAAAPRANLSIRSSPGAMDLPTGLIQSTGFPNQSTAWSCYPI